MVSWPHMKFNNRSKLSEEMCLFQPRSWATNKLLRRYPSPALRNEGQRLLSKGKAWTFVAARWSSVSTGVISTTGVCLPRIPGLKIRCPLQMNSWSLREWSHPVRSRQCVAMRTQRQISFLMSSVEIQWTDPNSDLRTIVCSGFAFSWGMVHIQYWTFNMTETAQQYSPGFQWRVECMYLMVNH